MAARIFLYPFLNDTEKYGLKILSKGWSLFYHRDKNEIAKLEYKPAEFENNLNCVETDGVWNPDYHDLCLSNRIVITHFRGLFGPSGIACHDAKLGVSVNWSSADSRQRGALKTSTFGISDDDFYTEEDRTSAEFDIALEFPSAALRGDVSFSVVLYIADAGTPRSNEKHLANEPGIILGEISSFTLRIDGTGSLFPVYEVYDKDKPLWYVSCDWLDPVSDSFADSVSISINKAHKNYRYINQADKAFCKQLLVEVMSAAVCSIVEEARRSVYWDQIIGEEVPERGSVAEAIRYFQDTLGWNLSSPLSASESARGFFDRRMPS